MEFKMFDVQDGYITPKDKRYSYYDIPIHELTFFEGENHSRWFSHMPEKNWFTEDYFWDMLKIAQHYHPNYDFSRHVFLGARIYQYHSMYDNAEFNIMLLTHHLEVIKKSKKLYNEIHDNP